MSTLAINLDDAFRACDPDRPLDAEDDRYVDLSEVRGTRLIAKQITRQISRCESGRYHQQLFTGHRGCGKSTELLRLKKELESQGFYTIYIDTEEQLDLADLNYLDVLLSIAKEIEEQLRQSEIKLNTVLLEDLVAWFSERIIEDQESRDMSAGIKTSAEAGTQIPLIAKLLASFTAEIKTASSRKVNTRQKLEQELAVFVDKLNLLILDAQNKVQKVGYRDLVIIVDGLEKMLYTQEKDRPSSHAQLFVHHAEQLKAPRCHIIYTMPISLLFNANLGNDFDSIQMLPMVKMNDAGIAKLREVIAERVTIDQTFEQAEMVDELARLSGGVIRDLMRLIRMASDTDKPVVGVEEIQYAKTSLIREYDRLLRDDDLEKLRWVKQHRRVQGDEKSARLLNLRIILEYQNGERWADLHPAVAEISWVRAGLTNHADNS